MPGDQRRPRPPATGPTVRWQPGLARDMLRDIAPLLAEEGIDVDNIDVPDLATLQAAMDRAVERMNMTRFTPVGTDRALATSTLRRAVEALCRGDARQAGAVLAAAQPEAPDHSAPTVAGCIGVALDMLDNWLTGRHPDAPAALGQRTQLGYPQLAPRTATDILALARKGRAFRSLDRLIVRHGGEQILHGGVTALTAAVRAWAASTDETPDSILQRHLA